MEVGYIRDLNLKPGDVVECCGLGCSMATWWTVGKEYIVTEDGTPADDDGDTYGHCDEPQPGVLFRVVSRSEVKQ